MGNRGRKAGRSASEKRETEDQYLERRGWTRAAPDDGRAQNGQSACWKDHVIGPSKAALLSLRDALMRQRSRDARELDVVLARSRFCSEAMRETWKILQEADEPVAERFEDSEGRVTLNLANVVRRLLSEKADAEKRLEATQRELIPAGLDTLVRAVAAEKACSEAKSTAARLRACIAAYKNGVLAHARGDARPDGPPIADEDSEPAAWALEGWAVAGVLSDSIKAEASIEAARVKLWEHGFRGPGDGERFETQTLEAALDAALLEMRKLADGGAVKEAEDALELARKDLRIAERERDEARVSASSAQAHIEVVRGLVESASARLAEIREATIDQDGDQDKCPFCLSDHWDENSRRHDDHCLFAKLHELSTPSAKPHGVWLNDKKVRALAMMWPEREVNGILEELGVHAGLAPKDRLSFAPIPGEPKAKGGAS